MMTKLLVFASLTVLGCVMLSVAAGAPSAKPAAKPLSMHQDAWVAHLLASGDRVEIGYGLDTPDIKSPTGVLYVRNDLQRGFARLPLKLKGTEFRAVVPGRLIRGHELLYYAVVREPRSGRSVTVPAGGGRAPQSAWILEKPLIVRLGTHRFGRPRAPEAVVGRAGPAEVGWSGPGDEPSGPETFLVGRDRSIWLDDGYNQRLLVWRPGRPDAVPRSVPLPFPPGAGGASDIAFGPAGTLYIIGGVPNPPRSFLYQLSLATGKVRWRSRLAGYVGENTALRVGPDGTVYALAADLGWMPVATPAGRPLSMAAQRRRAGYQPVVGGLRLLSETYAPYAGEGGRHNPPRDVRFALIDRNGRLVRAWRVVSRTAINQNFTTPELVGGDPVVVLDATAGAGRNFKLEYVVLRLGPGGTRSRSSLRRTVYGVNLLADLRVGPDGKLYQLGSSPTTGVVISRYSLGHVR
ncbi:MAG: hypothetical protein WBB74_12075 [Gaiellaceae bacterium]